MLFRELKKGDVFIFTFPAYETDYRMKISKTKYIDIDQVSYSQIPYRCIPQHLLKKRARGSSDVMFIAHHNLA